MRRAGVEMSEQQGFFIGKTDPTYGYICGRERGGKWGEGVRYQNGRWQRLSNPSSGTLQSYALYCGAYGPRNGA
jgi:hypothetical protein